MASPVRVSHPSAEASISLLTCLWMGASMGHRLSCGLWVSTWTAGPGSQGGLISVQALQTATADLCTKLHRFCGSICIDKVDAFLCSSPVYLSFSATFYPPDSTCILPYSLKMLFEVIPQKWWCFSMKRLLLATPGSTLLLILDWKIWLHVIVCSWCGSMCVLLVSTPLLSMPHSSEQLTLWDSLTLAGFFNFCYQLVLFMFLCVNG